MRNVDAQVHLPSTRIIAAGTAPTWAHLLDSQSSLSRGSHQVGRSKGSPLSQHPSHVWRL